MQLFRSCLPFLSLQERLRCNSDHKEQQLFATAMLHDDISQHNFFVAHQQQNKETLSTATQEPGCTFSQHHDTPPVYTAKCLTYSILFHPSLTETHIVSSTRLTDVVHCNTKDINVIVFRKRSRHERSLPASVST